MITTRLSWRQRKFSKMSRAALAVDCLSKVLSALSAWARMRSTLEVETTLILLMSAWGSRY